MQKLQGRYLPDKPINTFEDSLALVAKLPSLVTLRKENEQDVRDNIALVVLVIFDFYGEQVNKTQLELIVEAILDLGYYTNMADLKLFKKQAVEGKFKYRREIQNFGRGEQETLKYDFFRLTPDVIVEWWNRYLNERIKASEQVSITRAKEAKKETTISSKALDYIGKLLNRLDEKRVETKTEIIPENAELKANYNNIVTEFKRLAKDYDYEHKIQEYDKNSGRFCEYNNKVVDFHEFIKEYFQVAQQRINDELSQIKLFPANINN